MGNAWQEMQNMVAAQGGIRNPAPAAPPFGQQGAPMRPQQQRSGPDWLGEAAFINNEDRRNTPFSIGQVKDAAGGFGQGMQGAMGQMGAALAGNAGRAGQDRDRLGSFTNSIGALPFDLDPKGAQNWMTQNAQWDNGKFDRQLGQAGKTAAFQREQDAAAFPMQQQKTNAMLDMLRTLFGTSPHGGLNFGGFGGGASMPNSYQTNFGASGAF